MTQALHSTHPAETPLLQVKDLVREYTLPRDHLFKPPGKVHALNGVNFSIASGRSLGIVGESGSGKSTVARLILRLTPATAGQLFFDGEDITQLDGPRLRELRRSLQIVFQNPYASLNPRMTLVQTLEEPVRHHNPEMSRAEVVDRVAQVMLSVGVDPNWMKRYPHEFSGGQRQRIAIARALTVDPEFIVADEPISALDVSIQAQVLNLMLEAKEARGLTYLFITHDLSVVEHFGTKVVVLYLGSVCEIADTRTLFAAPKHPYTRALLSAVPQLKDDKPNHIRLKGEIPTPINLPAGCPFASRCSFGGGVHLADDRAGRASW